MSYLSTMPRKGHFYHCRQGLTPHPHKVTLMVTTNLTSAGLFDWKAVSGAVVSILGDPPNNNFVRGILTRTSRRIVNRRG